MIISFVNILDGCLVDARVTAVGHNLPAPCGLIPTFKHHVDEGRLHGIPQQDLHALCWR